MIYLTEASSSPYILSHLHTDGKIIPHRLSIWLSVQRGFSQKPTGCSTKSLVVRPYDRASGVSHKGVVLLKYVEHGLVDPTVTRYQLFLVN